MDELKQKVHDFWNSESCGEKLYLPGSDEAGYLSQMAARYKLEPYIKTFAKFEQACDLDVLEIGVGLGADHQCFAQAGARLTGIDLTERAIDHTRKRLSLFGLKSNLRVSDAETLPFANESFDLVYSWGVVHHSPDTPCAIEEIRRVLRSGGRTKIMIYNRYSLVAYMLWIRYALLAGRPWRNLNYITDHYLQGPGPKAYTVDEAREMFRKFAEVEISTVLTHADLLESPIGQRHRGWVLTLANRIWPQRLLRKLLPGHGLFMMIEAKK